LAFMPSIGTDIAAFAIFAAVYLTQRKRVAETMEPITVKVEKL